MTRKKFTYPETRKKELAEDFHGIKVGDPYRWLEEAETEEVRSWAKAQNDLTHSFLRKGNEFSETRRRLTELWNYEKFSAPRKRGKRYFFFKNDGLQNQMVLYQQEGLDDNATAVIDPNTWSADGTSALENLAISKDGKRLAYGRGEAGSDWQNIRVLDVDKGKEFDETLKWCRFSAISWKKDETGFYYNRYPEAGTVPKEDGTNFSRICLHKPGTEQDADELIYEDADNKELDFYPHVTEDGKYLLIHVSLGTDPKNRIYYKQIDGEGKIIKLLDKMDAEYNFIHNVDSAFYFKTNLDAPRGRIVAIDIQNPERKNWTEIVPQGTDTIESVSVVNGQLIVTYMHHAYNQIKLYDLDGSCIGDIELPAMGAVGPVNGKPDDKEMFFIFTSYLYPFTVFRYDFEQSKLEVFAKPNVDFDPDAYETRQVFYASKDGTKVPMFITHKKGLKLDGTNPTILYGYGGFTVSLTPSFSPANLVWLQQGGVYALANLRGGNEYGEDWHQAGMLANKQNVFDDFIAAAQWLIDSGYTTSKKLAIRGGSNGGLLVAACMIQRPELFGAVICQVPVIDMLRYHRWTIGRYWVPEYGNAERDAGHFKFMHAYSPLHNVKDDVAHPPILIMTADTDDRVFPAHSFKFAATLQEKDTGNNPILLRVEKKAGHGHGKPTTKIIESNADIFAFLFKTFGMG